MSDNEDGLTPDSADASGGDGNNGENGAAAGALPDDIAPVSLVAEMRKSYLDYAMSVIVSRALPDVRDGLKVQTSRNYNQVMIMRSPLPWQRSE